MATSSNPSVVPYPYPMGQPVLPSTATTSGLLISSELDALRVFEAARLYPTYFPMVGNRIEDWKTRLALFVHGSVFIFERRLDFARWTDGRRWMPNQQIGPFLCYEEAMRRQTTHNTYRQGVNKGERGYIRPDIERKDGGLQKWTYTVHVATNPHVSLEKRIWEMIWYLQPERFTNGGHGLVPVSQHDFLRTINIPMPPQQPHVYFMEGSLALPRPTSHIIRISETGPLRSPPPYYTTMAAAGPSIPRPMSVPPQFLGMRGQSVAMSDSSEEMSPPQAFRLQLPPSSQEISPPEVFRVQLPPCTEILMPSRTIAYDHARLPSYEEFITRTRSIPESAFEPRRR